MNQRSSANSNNFFFKLVGETGRGVLMRENSGRVASESSGQVVEGVTQVSERAKRLMW